MGAEKQVIKMKEAFDLAQNPHQNHAKLVAALKCTYDKLEDKTIFHEEFVQFLKYPMVVYKREPTVERVIDFAAKFATTFKQLEGENDNKEDEEEEESPFLNYLFDFLLKSHKANSHAVRFRVCQLINKLLGNMPENAQIDDELFDRIYEALLIRLTDRFPNVRIQAVLAMARLQDPQDDKCPVVNAYMHLLEQDLNPEVRRAVLSYIAPTAKTLQKIVGRTMDTKESVRKLAYQVLAEKIHVRTLSIAQRVQLLQQGLNDRSVAVKEAVEKKLLPAWLRLSEGNVLDLLHRLDVENCPEVAISALNAIFALTPLNELVQNCTNIDNQKLIPVENLTTENTLYWRALCEYIKSKGDEAEEFLERILPEAAIYANYLLSYLKSIPVLTEEQRTDFSQIENLMTKEFIGQQLILLVGCLAIEEGGRKCLLSVIQEILVWPSTPISLISLLVEKLTSILKDDDKRIEMIAEIISEVCEPIVTTDVPVDANESRRRQVKLAEVKVKLIEAKQALEESIANQNFSHASELKEKITELESLKSDLIKETEQPEIKEIRVEKNDPETLLKCLTMCYELLKEMSISMGISPTMNGIIESLIFPGITNVHPAVRNMAVLCLGSCALRSKDFASQHLTLLLQISQIDDVKVRVSALKAVFDQLLLFGIEVFKEKQSNSEDPLRKNSITENDEEDLQQEQTKTEEFEVETDTVNSILTLLSRFLDSEIAELRTETMEGLAKLLLFGRLVSPRLLSRLVLLWYNPMTEDDIRLRHFLGVFFPVFAFARRTNQECFEEAFLPTLRTLFNAPGFSPLAEVDISNVAELLVDLTRPSGLNHELKQAQDYQETTVHDSLAIKICNEILKDPSAPDVRIYAKVLGSLELHKEYTQDLQVLLDQILQEVKDKTCHRALEKIKNQLHGAREEASVAKEGDNQDNDQTLNLPQAQTEDTDKTKSATGKRNRGSSCMFNLTEDTEKTKSATGKRNRGQRKGSTVTRSAVKTRRRMQKAAESSEESDAEVQELPLLTLSSRPSRRAKTAALEKTRMNLTRILNKEAK
uniref:Non-SMC condensin I complex subunit G n=1 Tax=Latimeria chalumnae TaxID=7897 RepID=H3BDF7_LATCH